MITCAQETLPHGPAEMLEKMLRRFCIVLIFGIAFAYIEAAVVIYLRTIFHSDGFTFPLCSFPITQKSDLLLTEIGREAATLVLISSGACLIGRSFQQRFAFFLTIFAVWDIFYYVWLKLLVNWPSSIMDWDILFLIPTTWASPVLAPVLVSVMLLLFAIIILYYCSSGVSLKLTLADWLGFFVAALVVVVSFCIAGLHISEPDFRSHFHWSLFALGNAAALALFFRCVLKSK